MNYYINGGAASANKIKAAFERLGYDTRVNGWNFNSDRGVYFTNEADKLVDYTCIDIFINLIKTHPNYQELELPVKDKDKVGNCEKKELKKIEPKTLDSDKVIEWLKTKVYGYSTYGVKMIEQFKKDFGI